MRPAGPGGLILALNDGSEVFSVDLQGPKLAFRRAATADEDAALSRAAQLTVERPAERGLRAQFVARRPSHCKIDLIPELAWEDPPKSRIAELVAAVERRLGAAGWVIVAKPGRPDAHRASARAPQSQARRLPVYWTVRRGDTFTEIARKTGLTVAELEAFNPTSTPWASPRVNG